MKHIKPIFSLLLLFVIVECKSQGIDKINNAKIIRGVVSDIYGPMPEVQINAKNTERKTSTDVDGKFEIEVKEGEVLIFQYVSMEDAVITIDSKNDYQVFLTPAKRPEPSRKHKRYIRRQIRKNGDYAYPD